MKIEVLKPFNHSGLQFHEGEIRIVDDVEGEYFCRAGWVRDTSGTVATANPGPQDVVLLVQDMQQAQSSPNVN